MRILAIAFAFGLVGCVDTETPEGQDDIEEASDDFGPDVLKGDVDNAPEPKRRDTEDVGYECGYHGVDCTPSFNTTTARTPGTAATVNQVNQVPRR